MAAQSRAGGGRVSATRAVPAGHRCVSRTVPGPFRARGAPIPRRRAAEGPRPGRRVPGGGPGPGLLAPTTPLPALGFCRSRSGSRPAGHNAVEGRRNSFVLPKASQLIKLLLPRGPAFPTPSAPRSFHRRAGAQAPCAYPAVFPAILYEGRELENEAEVQRNVFPTASTARMALRARRSAGTSRAGWQPPPWATLPGTGSPTQGREDPSEHRPPQERHTNTSPVFFQIKSGAAHWGGGRAGKNPGFSGQDYLINEEISSAEIPEMPFQRDVPRVAAGKAG